MLRDRLYAWYRRWRRMALRADTPASRVDPLAVDRYLDDVERRQRVIDARLNALDIETRLRQGGGDQ